MLTIQKPWPAPTKSRSSRNTPPPPPPLNLPHDIIPFVELAAGFPLDSDQRAILTSPDQWILINCFRQWGKSTITAGKALHLAWTRPGSLILIASPCGRQSAEFLHKAEQMLRRLGIRPRGDGNNELSILFPNSSRIIGLPGNDDTVRGFSGVNLLIFDEASRIPDAIYTALRPSTVAANGSVWALSTPNGRQGFFWDCWREEGWTRFAVTGWQCARFPKQRLERERRALKSRFAQEYECQFLDADTQLIPGHYLDKAVRRDVEPLELFHPATWRRFVPEDAMISWREFTVGVDLGKRRNPTAIAVIERRATRTGRQIAWDLSWETIITWNVRYLERLPLYTPYHEVVEQIRRVVRDPTLQKGHVELVVDATGVGEMPLEALERQQLGCTLIPVTITSGDAAVKDAKGRWKVPRWELLTGLSLTLEQGSLGIAAAMPETERLLSEIRGWRIQPGQTHDRIVGGADPDGNDDLAFAVALANWRSAKIVRDMNGRRRVL